MCSKSEAEKDARFQLRVLDILLKQEPYRVREPVVFEEPSPEAQRMADYLDSLEFSQNEYHECIFNAMLFNTRMSPKPIWKGSGIMDNDQGSEAKTAQESPFSVLKKDLQELRELSEDVSQSVSDKAVFLIGNFPIEENEKSSEVEPVKQECIVVNCTDVIRIIRKNLHEIRNSVRNI